MLSYSIGIKLFMNLIHFIAFFYLHELSCMPTSAQYMSHENATFQTDSRAKVEFKITDLLNNLSNLYGNVLSD
jgi:hypothetical protein